MSEKRLRPSSARIWVDGGCGASLDLRNYDEGSVYAAEGTEAHDCASAILQGYKLSAQRCQQCHVFTEAPCPECGCDHTYVDKNREEMLVAVNKYVAYIDELKKTKAFTYYAIEQKLEHPDLPELGGTIDCLMLYSDESGGPLVVHVVDYKHGAGLYVPCEDNPQMKCYLMIAVAHLREAGVIGEAFPQLRKTIVQPRSYRNDDEHYVSTVEVTAEELHEWSEKVFDAALSRSYKAGPHCRMCNSITYCKLMRDAVEDAAELDLETEPTADWMRILDLTPGIKKLLDLIPARLSAAMQNGLHVDGHKLVRAVGNSTWRLKDDELLAVLKERKIGPRMATTKTVKIKSPTQIRDLIKKTKRLKNQSIEDLAFRPDKGLIVVPESDKREAISFETPEETFAKEEDYVDNSQS